MHEALAAELGLSTHFSTILAHRKLSTREEGSTFLTPTMRSLADPMEMTDMQPAVARLVQAVEEGEPLAVFGDYDVDGATSSALLTRYFRALDMPIRVYIPDRLTEGYGPNPNAMRALYEEGFRLLITVDCGVSAFAAMDEAAALGLEVIVTDHHRQDPEGLPQALAVINPNRADETFPHKELAGVGVAFYLTMALNRALRERGWFAVDDHPKEPDLRRLLDLVAVGTVADVARIVGANRPLVAAGLKRAPQGDNLGLLALIEKVGVKLRNGALGVGQVGFQIGPRINAAGRLSMGALGCELLTTEDPRRARELAELLDETNRERQELEQTILDEALELIEKKRLLEHHTALVVAGCGWHPGVIGIVCSRIVEKYHRPAFVVAIDEESGEGKASGRSIPGVDLLEAVVAAREHLVYFGGHKMAAGFTIREENLPAFEEQFDRAICEANDPDLFMPTLLVDGALPLSAANMALTQQLQRLEPFGPGNPEPVFVLKGVRMAEARILKDAHVKCSLEDGVGNRIDGIVFRAWPGPLGEGLMNVGATMDLCGTLSVNSFRGRDSVQMMIRDARFSEA
ncbi:MAG: single-stranded-DNA-specific exonuclease RecJ [Magnetococcales bacterium]|nr:single-stranded-DNA-specific exonuclease RecJ [Magnetococcales bacterium]